MTTLGDVLLALLTRKPVSSYDLVQTLKRPLGY